MERENNNKSDSDASKASKNLRKEETAEVPSSPPRARLPARGPPDAARGHRGDREPRLTSLAALGPNTAVFQIVFQLFSFLSITTTGMVAPLRGRRQPRRPPRLANASIPALVFGGATCLGLNAFAADVL